MSEMPIEVYVRDANREVIGQTSTWTSVMVVARRNDVGTWTLVTSNPDDAELLTPVVNSNGAITANKGVILRRPNASGVPTTFMSGWLSKEATIEASGDQITWTFTGYDDTFLLLRALCWPKPTAAVNLQTDTHDIRTGTASDRMRGYFTANVINRMNVPGANAGNDTGLGPVAVSKARFAGLLEMLQQIAGRNLNFQVLQRDSDRALVLRIWAPQDKRLDVQFSPALGSVHGWKRDSAESTVNNVIIGAGGEMELRVFRRFIDTPDQTAWGAIEQFKDRRDLSPDDPTIEDQIAVDALEFLEENIGRSTFSFDVSGTPDARPFVHFAPGDLVRGYIGQDTNGQVFGLTDDLIEQVEDTFSASGETGSIQIGKPDENLDDTTARKIRLMERRLNDLETER